MTNKKTDEFAYDVAALVCPECMTYLLEKESGGKFYKSCNSCGYAREIVVTTGKLIPDNIMELKRNGES